MEKMIEFVGNNYAWFLTISIILLFALIGYIVDTKRTKNDIFKKNEDEMNESILNDIMSDNNNTNKSLSDMVSKSKNINAETKSVELVDETILNNQENNNTTTNTNKVQ